MAQFQKSTFNTRKPPKTKSELREMLAEAVRNTKLPDQKRPPKPKESATRAVSVHQAFTKEF